MQYDKPTFTMVPKESLTELDPFSNEWVMAAVAASDWFTPDFILGNRQRVEKPARNLFIGYTDSEIQTFLDRYHDVLLLPEDAQSKMVFFQIWDFIKRRLILADGNSADLSLQGDYQQLCADLAKVGLNEPPLLNRNLNIERDHMLLCIIAPTNLRDRIVRAMIVLSDDELVGNNEIMILSQLVRLFAKQYLQLLASGEKPN